MLLQLLTSRRLCSEHSVHEVLDNFFGEASIRIQKCRTFS
jgi:hypothetical protein